VKCHVCDRAAKEKYCVLHDKAYRNIVQKFEDWQKATGVSWKEYLNAVVEHSSTGCWAKEVAEQLLNNKDE